MKLHGTQRVHVPNNSVLGIWVIVIIVQVLGKYMIIWYLDPRGSLASSHLAVPLLPASAGKAQ